MIQTEFIAHRINTVAELLTLPEGVGLELDLRDRGEDLILQHDPFKEGELFETFLKSYKQRKTLILNIKSERIELRVLELLKEYKIEEYFFLDSSFPMIFHLSNLGEHKIAVRFSELESLESVLLLKGRVDWVWVDCFTKLPLDHSVYQKLKDAGFKLCLVSPELQGRPEDILNYKTFLEREKIVIDAICTKIKNFHLWQSRSNL